LAVIKPRIVDLDQAIALLGSTESAVGEVRAKLIAGLGAITELSVRRTGTTAAARDGNTCRTHKEVG
jgi:hypothetical protein